MTDHTHRVGERHCDVVVVGGSAAGLAAALQLGRQRRSVIVVDDATPRNAAAAHMHSFLGFEGRPPSELLDAGRAEVRSYGGEVLRGRVTRVVRAEDGGFRVELDGGHSILARRVLAATGLEDVLPDIAGVAQHWGRDVIHCPFCHGFEARDGRLVQIVTHSMALHVTALLRRLTDRLTVVIHEPVELDAGELDALRASGVAIIAGRVGRILADDAGRVASVELAGGRRIDADTVLVGPRFRARTEPFAPLGLRPTVHPSGLGEVVETDATGATAVAGVYAAGNVTDPSHQVLQAAADGSRVGGMISIDLAQEDVRAGTRPSANEVDWDERYGAERLWSGNPNGTFADEVSTLSPGRALDVGAGEGGDALWLAARGWRVTASDVSQRALDRIAREAHRQSLSLELHHADANALDAFAAGGYDLVSAQYASIPRTPDDRGVHNLIGAVAPGGTLLVVSHDLAPLRAPRHAGTPTALFDPDAYIRVDDVLAILSGSAGWTIEVHETRMRAAGAASGSHHVQDVVLRARRSDVGESAGR